MRNAGLRAAATVSVCAALGALLLHAAQTVPPRLFFGAGESAAPSQYVDSGEALLHRHEPPGVSASLHLPASSALAAELLNHAAPRLFRAARLGLFFAAPILTAALACLLAPPPAALLAAAIPLAAPSVLFTRSGYSHFVYSLLVLLAAALLVWRSRHPTPKRTTVLAAGLGATLLFRSPLAFLPPLLAARELWAGRRRQALLLAIVPYLFLAPWVRMNWAARHRFIPFEAGEATPNVVSGAAGLVHTWDGDWKWQSLIAGKVKDDETGTVLLWAAGEVARHPVRYAEAFVRRLAYAVALQPLLVLLAALALRRFRKREEFAGLALFCGYYLGVHCLMAVQDGYFVPLWPIAAALTGALVFGGRRPLETDRFYKGALGVVCAGLACLAVLDAFALRAAARFARGPLSEALAESPRDSWLLYWKGREELRAGRFREAAADLFESASRPYDHERRLDGAWALALAGDRRALESFWVPDEGDAAFSAKLAVLQAYALIQAGDRRAARERLEPVLPAEEGERGPFAEAEFADRFAKLLAEAPPKARLAVFDELVTLRPRAAAYWSERASAAAQAGNAAAVGESSLRAVELTRATAGSELEQARLYEQLSDLGAAAQALERRAARSPDAAIRLAQGRNALKRGDRRAALAFLGQAKQALPSPAESRELALLLQSLGRTREARDILAALAAGAPGDAGLLRDLGVAEFLDGDADAAVRDLDRSARLEPGSAETLVSLGSAYARRGRRDEALKAYDDALKLAPHDELLLHVLTISRDRLLKDGRK